MFEEVLASNNFIPKLDMRKYFIGSEQCNVVYSS